MKAPRITNHQLNTIFGLADFDTGSKYYPRSPKSWINPKGNRVWQFRCDHKGYDKVGGDPWDTQTGESLLKKGLIEPSFSAVYDESYPYEPGAVIQHYRLSQLGKDIVADVNKRGLVARTSWARAF